jgi:hypothetical protein
VLCGGGKTSYVNESTYGLRKTALPTIRGVTKGEGREHDREFVRSFLPRLRKCGVVEFVGHGMPEYVAGGPDAEDLEGWKSDAPVILSVPCFTGVTHVWYQEDHRAGVWRKRTVPLEKSFALRVIAAGPCGYTAYLCGRPAGPELYTDLLRLVVDGMTLGEARRRDYDKTVLGFVGFGEERMVLEPRHEGLKLRQPRDSVRDIMLEGAAGGILYGDPAVKPFRPRKGEDPVEVLVHHVRSTGAGDGDLVVSLACPRSRFWSLCGDQTARFDGSMALRAYARVPLGDRGIADVVTETCQLGDRKAGNRLIWAVEEDQGKRWLHLKLMFSRKEAKAPGDLSARVRVRTTDGKGRTWGGETEMPQRKPRGGGGGVARRDLGSTEIDVALERAARRFQPSPEALVAALRATAATIGKGDVSANQALDELAKHGSDGFKAVCTLLLVGHHHYRTWQLFRATYRHGDEKILLELAEETLPGFGTWSALEGLGATDAAKARTYLLARLKREKGSGLFMSAAQGLAHLGERRAVPVIAERLLAFEPAWSGVERHLVTCLGRLGGPEARRALERYAKDERAKGAATAQMWLKNMK